MKKQLDGICSRLNSTPVHMYACVCVCVCVYGAGGGVVDTWIRAHDEGVNNACVCMYVYVRVRVMYVSCVTCACVMCVCDVCVCV
jgi:hypothetical protein